MVCWEELGGREQWRAAKTKLPLWSGHGFDHFLHSDDVDYSLDASGGSVFRQLDSFGDA